MINQKTNMRHMLNMAPKYTLLFTSILAVMYPSDSYSLMGNSTDTCRPVYSNIDDIAVHADLSLFSKLNAKKFINDLTMYPSRLIEEAGIKIDGADNHKGGSASLAEADLKIKVVFSFAEKEKFSHEPEKGVLINWLELTNNSGGKPITMEFSPHYHSVSDPNNLTIEDILAYTQQDINEAICNSLKYSKNKICTDVKNIRKSKLKDNEIKCVEESK